VIRAKAGEEAGAAVEEAEAGAKAAAANRPSKEISIVSPELQE